MKFKLRLFSLLALMSFSAFSAEPSLNEIIQKVESIYDEQSLSDFQKSVLIRGLTKGLDKNQKKLSVEEAIKLNSIGVYLRRLVLSNFEKQLISIPGYVYLKTMDERNDNSLTKIEKLNSSFIHINNKEVASKMLSRFLKNSTERSRFNFEYVQTARDLIEKTKEQVGLLLQGVRVDGTVEGVFYNVKNPTLAYVLRRIDTLTSEEKEVVLTEALKVYRLRFPNSSYNIFAEFKFSDFEGKVKNVSSDPGQKPSGKLKTLLELWETLQSREMVGLSENQKSKLEELLSLEINKYRVILFQELFTSSSTNLNRYTVSTRDNLFMLNQDIWALNEDISNIDLFLKDPNSVYLTAKERKKLALISRENLTLGKNELEAKRSSLYESLMAQANIKNPDSIPVILSLLETVLRGQRVSLSSDGLEEVLDALAESLSEGTGNTLELSRFGKLGRLEFLLFLPPYNANFLLNPWNGGRPTYRDSELNTFLRNVKKMKFDDSKTGAFYKLYFALKAMAQTNEDSLFIREQIVQDGLRILKELIEVEFKNNEKLFENFLITLKMNNPFYYALIKNNATKLLLQLSDNDSGSFFHQLSEFTDNEFSLLIRLVTSEALGEEFVSNENKAKINSIRKNHVDCAHGLSIFVRDFRI